jgi:hypothetical protein
MQVTAAPGTVLVVKGFLRGLSSRPAAIFSVKNALTHWMTDKGIPRVWIGIADRAT